ncbi:MAG: hypothetical protein ACLFPL_02555 [Candidatus Nanoarchaeia archaeon]
MTKDLTTDEKVQLIQETFEEIIDEEKLRELFKEQEEGKINQIRAYDGFEPSGQIHIAQGLMRAIQVNKLTKCGITFIFWVADYFAWLNNKYGGDLEKIQTCGKYLIEVWKSCGMDLKNVEFRWTSKDLENNPTYWENFLQLSTHASVSRVLRCGQIMGREENTENPASQIIYPLMQANDIHHLKAHIAQLGLDQRKVNMLARDIFPKMNWEKPVVISHHMLLGLQKIDTEPNLTELKIESFGEYEFNGTKIILDETGSKYEDGSFLSIVQSLNKPKKSVKIKVDNSEFEVFEDNWKNCGKIGIRLKEINEKKGNIIISIKSQKNEIDRKIEMKMSKSKPDTAIFMTDSKEDVERKFKKAHSVDGVVEDNPILEYFKYIVFERFEEVEIQRPEKFGGLYRASSYNQLVDDFENQTIKSIDLKTMCAKYVNELLEPTRSYFEENNEAKQLLERVQSFAITR